MNNFNNSPNLIEPGMKTILKKSLTNFHKFRNDNYNFYFNIITLMLVITLISIFLYTRYRGNINDEEIKEKNRLKKEYILSKLMLYSDMETKRRTSKGLITDLPVWEGHPEKKNLDIKNITFD